MLIVKKLVKKLPAFYMTENSFPLQNTVPLAFVLKHVKPIQNVILFKAGSPM
jgi:hypothetical protein